MPLVMDSTGYPAVCGLLFDGGRIYLCFCIKDFPLPALGGTPALTHNAFARLTLPMPACLLPTACPPMLHSQRQPSQSQNECLRHGKSFRWDVVTMPDQHADCPRCQQLRGAAVAMVWLCHVPDAECRSAEPFKPFYLVRFRMCTCLKTPGKLIFYYFNRCHFLVVNFFFC